MRLLALEYHDVVAGEAFDASGFPGPDAASYKMRRPDFDAHLAAIAAAYAGPQRTVLAPGAADAAGGPTPVVLTFDDGGVTAYTETVDPLERHGWRGHFFITTDYLGAPGFVSREQLREMHRRGHVLGSHSCSHPLRMSQCPAAQIDREWRESVAILSDVLGEPVTVASVPGGGYARHVAEAAAAAGIRYLFTSEPVTSTHVVDGCRVIGRYTLRRSTPAALAARLAVGDLAPRARQWATWNAKKVVKRTAGSLYLQTRRWLFERASR
jgi:peptidoglycan/xylan/chitin deacetylase (PgdA/CDA1 family)